MITQPAKENTNLENLEKTIDELMLKMKNYEPTTPEYVQMADQLEKLYKLKEIDSKKRVSPDVLANICASLAGIFMILTYEHGRVVTSKALNFVPKLFR